MESNVFSINELYIKKYLDLMFEDPTNTSVDVAFIGINRTLFLNLRWYGREHTEKLIEKFELDQMGFSFDQIKRTIEKLFNPV